MSGTARVFLSQTTCDCSNQRFVPALLKPLSFFSPTVVLLITNPRFREAICLTPLKEGRVKVEIGAGF